MHSQIGSLGQVVVRNPVAAKKKRDKVEEGEKKVMKKIPGPGKGNWSEFGRVPRSECMGSADLDQSGLRRKNVKL